MAADDERRDRALLEPHSPPAPPPPVTIKRTRAKKGAEAKAKAQLDDDEDEDSDDLAGDDEEEEDDDLDGLDLGGDDLDLSIGLETSRSALPVVEGEEDVFARDVFAERDSVGDEADLSGCCRES
jgi:tRNA nucleotidyltransferase (CCA-adding enzyme)